MALQVYYEGRTRVPWQIERLRDYAKRMRAMGIWDQSHPEYQFMMGVQAGPTEKIAELERYAGAPGEKYREYVSRLGKAGYMPYQELGVSAYGEAKKRREIIGELQNRLKARLGFGSKEIEELTRPLLSLPSAVLGQELTGASTSSLLEKIQGLKGQISPEAAQRYAKYWEERPYIPAGPGPSIPRHELAATHPMYKPLATQAPSPQLPIGQPVATPLPQPVPALQPAQIPVSTMPTAEYKPLPFPTEGYQYKPPAPLTWGAGGQSYSPYQDQSLFGWGRKRLSNNYRR